jgi:hypothetical protein
MVKSRVYEAEAFVRNRKGDSAGWNHFADDHEHGSGRTGNPNPNHPAIERICPIIQSQNKDGYQSKTGNTCTCPDTDTTPCNQGVVELSQRYLLEAYFQPVGNIHLVAAQAMG